MSFYLRSWESHWKILSSRGITGSDLYCRKSTLDAVERLWSLDGVGTVVQAGAGGSYGLGLWDGKRSGSKKTFRRQKDRPWSLLTVCKNSQDTLLGFWPLDGWWCHFLSDRRRGAGRNGKLQVWFRSFGQVWLELPGRQLLYRPKLRKDPQSWESKTYSNSVSHGWASPMGYVQHWEKRGQVVTLMKAFTERVWQNAKPGRGKEAWRRWVIQLENGLGSPMYFENQLFKFCENLMGFLIKTSLNLWFICGVSTSLYFPNHEHAISSPFI